MAYFLLLSILISITCINKVHADLSRPKPSGLRIAPKKDILPGQAFQTNKLRVALLTGIRAPDGLGDLSLNRIFIDEQVKNIKRKYGSNVEIHIVFMNEVYSTITPFKRREALKKVYQEVGYDLPLQFFDKQGSKSSSSPQKLYLRLKDGLRFWKEEDFKAFAENHLCLKINFFSL